MGQLVQAMCELKCVCGVCVCVGGGGGGALIRACISNNMSLFVWGVIPNSCPGNAFRPRLGIVH